MSTEVNKDPQTEVEKPLETDSKRLRNETLPKAFSRRESDSKSRPLGTSVYSGEKKDMPAWLKSEKPVDKYDKYGARPSQASLQEDSSKYSKYISNSNSSSNERIKRKYEEEEEEERDPREDLRGDPREEARDKYVDESTAQPYSNIAVANPAMNHIKEYQTFHSRINRTNQDINSIVRSHYNQRTYQSKFQGSRTKSPIYKLRNFNNAIKYILLGNFVKKDPDSKRPSSILDLCCGKGGDLNKCEFVEIDQYIGIDISDASVKEAFTRYSQNRARFIPQNGNKRKDAKRYQFEACFATGDCFGTPIPEILEPNFPGIIAKIFPVDSVSIQFALHYAFETEEKLRMLITNVTKSLRSGGTFIGTIPSSDFIRDKVIHKAYIPTDNGKRRFGNDIYTVTFDNEPPEDGVFRPPFGNRYNYSLKDAIDDVPEYVVPFETLRAICEDYGLVLKYKKNFIDIFNQEIPKYFSKLNKNLIEGMKRSDGKYGAEGSEKEAVGFYVGFVFEKL
jgi:mRNA (guanine-N7-)-methyltransferase